MRSRLALLAIAAAALSASPLSAQDGSEGVKTRTPETAQAFLAKVFSSGTMRLTSHFANSSWGLGLKQYHVFEPGYVTDWGKDPNVPNECQSAFKASAVYSWKEATDYGWRDDLNPIWMAVTPDHTPTWQDADYTSTISGKGIVDWKSVGEISASGPYVTLRTRIAQDYRFDLGNGELASRVALAMNVLRSACDPTADENF